ncbi:MAG: polysaccharide biosynthesis protein [Patescibacteria group bacterium]|nr:polysaccharide biosynthesis protein [Patescibacteria group bacterium]
MGIFSQKRIVITGGTGSLGKVLVRRILSFKEGKPKKIIIFSRDEAKQHYMRLEYQHMKNVTEEVIYNNFRQLVEFRIGDVRRYESICSVLKDADIIINAAALKQVPTCEYFPYEAVQTNIGGAENIIRVLRENNFPVKTVVGVSTDKACKPVNVMGMTKALQERVFISGNIFVPKTRFVCVRYGNVLASRGSVIPLFYQQIKNGGPLTITTEEMTRFLLPLEKAVDTIFAAIKDAKPGEIYIPQAASSLITNIAKILVGERKIKIKCTGIRPGEKVHEILISDEESWHTVERKGYYVIQAMLPELIGKKINKRILPGEFSSANAQMDLEETKKMLTKYKLLFEHQEEKIGEILA